MPKTYRRRPRRHKTTYRRRKGGMMRKLTGPEFSQRFMRQTYSMRPEDQTILDQAEEARLAAITQPQPQPQPTTLLEPALEQEAELTINEAAMIEHNPWYNATIRFAIFDWIYRTCDMRTEQVNRAIKAARNNNVSTFINYFLAIQIVDQYMCAVATNEKDCQAVAAVAILLASKYEDVRALRITDIYYLIDRTYTKSQLIETESNIVATLPHLYAPTIYTFFQLKKGILPRNDHAYLFQLVCCASVIQQFIGTPPSEIVDACINYIDNVEPDTRIQLPFMPFTQSLKGKHIDEQYASLIHIYAAIMSNQ